MTATTLRHATVLGLGLMGAGMATSLLAAGFEVTVYNRSRAKRDALAARGARAAATPAEAAAAADVVVAMVADDDASRAVWLGQEGALAAMKPDAIAIESSTITVAWARSLAREAAGAGIAFLDAPVTGSREQAESGALRFMIGGENAAIERARPALMAMGSATLPVGAPGNGALMKLINNFVCGVQVGALAEALAIAERSGLDPAVAAAVLAEGAPGSPLVKAVSRRMIERDVTPNFFISLMAKDLRYAARTFAEAGIDAASADAARARFEEAERAGHGQEDIATVIEPLRARAAPR